MAHDDLQVFVRLSQLEANFAQKLIDELLIRLDEKFYLLWKGGSIQPQAILIFEGYPHSIKLARGCFPVVEPKTHPPESQLWAPNVAHDK